MWKKLPKPYKFIFTFLVIAGLLLISWKIITILYLYLLVYFAKPIWSVFGYPVQLAIRDNVLHFVYMKIALEPISFSVHQSDEIYLNLIIMLALFGATFLIFERKIKYSFLFSLVIIFIIHEFVLYMYAYTNIWEFADSLDINNNKELINNISGFFSKSTAGFFDNLLFHWNAYGWDVVPLILWIFGIYKFIFPRIFLSKQ